MPRADIGDRLNNLQRNKLTFSSSIQSTNISSLSIIMEQWLQDIDVAEPSNQVCRKTQTSRRERREKYEKTHEQKSSSEKKDAVIYVYKRFVVEKGCSGGCGYDILKASFHSKWNRGQLWMPVGSLRENSDEVLISNMVQNEKTMCCGGFTHYENFRQSLTERTHRQSLTERTLTYQQAIALLARKH